MGKSRFELHEVLEAIVESGSVYFQPPENLAMVYPCIVYNRETIPGVFADNVLYRYTTLYSVTVIDANPDSEIVQKLLLLPLCKHNNAYISDNLNHDTFNLYF